MENKKPRKVKVCPLCGKGFTGKAYLTWPLVENPNKKCCKECYDNIIAPAEDEFILILKAGN